MVHLKNVVIACGEDIVIEIKKGIIKIIVGEDSKDLEFGSGSLMVVYPAAENDLGLQGISGLWNKVKDAFANVKEKIKAKSQDLFDKVAPIADKVVEKYKVQIMEA